jgi:hypothetical protein
MAVLVAGALAAHLAFPGQSAWAASGNPVVHASSLDWLPGIRETAFLVLGLLALWPYRKNLFTLPPGNPHPIQTDA